MLKIYQKFALCSLLLALPSAIFANCLEDVKKYRLDKALYEECLKEAEANDVNPQLHYLLGLWNYTGIHDGAFDQEPNLDVYRHFMYLAGKAENNEAKAMYVITEYDLEKAISKTLNPNVVRFLDSLARDKSEEGLLRYLQVKLAINGFDAATDEPKLKKLADDPKNYEAALAYAKYLQQYAASAEKKPSDIDKAKAYYDRIINAKDSNDILKGQANWYMYRYYRSATLANTVMKSEPYLKNLAYMGDILAQLLYGDSFKTFVYGILDLPKAYAWGALARECSKKVSGVNYNTSNVDTLEKSLEPKDLEAGKVILKQLAKDHPCRIENRTVKPQIKK